MPPDPINVAARELASTVAVFTLIATAVVSVVLMLLHVVALHGRRVLPVGVQRVAAAVTIGAFLGQLMLSSWRDPFWWLLVGAFLTWVGRWYVRERRFTELGLLLAAGGVPWTLVFGWILVVEPIDPTQMLGPDPRFLFAVGGLVVTAAGTALAIAGPGLASRPRVPTMAERGAIVGRAIERAQAVGPIAAPAALGVISGTLVSTTATLWIGRSALELGWPVLPLLVFALVAAPVWLVSTPRRVSQALESLTWLVGRESERWQAIIGRRLPIPARSVPRLFARLPDTDEVRPLRVELLAGMGRIDEARAELARLPLETPSERFEHAVLREHVSFCGSAPDERQAIRAALDELTDEEARLEGEAHLAYADARRAALAGGDALAPLVAIRPAIGSRAGRYQLGHRRGVVLVVAGIALVGAVATVVLNAAFG